MKSSSKIVYILGAGISKAAGLPMQAEILTEIANIKNTIDSHKMLKDIKSNVKTENVLEYYDSFIEDRKKLIEFVGLNFFDFLKKQELKRDLDYIEKRTIIDDDFDLYLKKEALGNYLLNTYISLEDVFTLLDKIRISNEYYKGYSIEKTEAYLRVISKCIIYMFAYKLSTISSQNNIVNQFIDVAIEKMEQGEDFTLITTNWDTLLERAVLENKKYQVDYGCYNFETSSKEQDLVDERIKIYKLHGSLNWLICPQCGRLYIDRSKDIALNIYNPDYICKKCAREGYLINPIPMLLMPTYIKDINNFYLKEVWHNAYIEISNADRIVFIGYSLPEADFEFKYLLKRAIRNGTKIDVVLTSSSDPIKIKQDFLSHKYTEDEAIGLINRLNLPEYRYKSFFDSPITFHYDGIEGFLKEL